jgi:hypothetical protein
MYRGRRLRYNEVLTICAREADGLSGLMAPLILKLDCIRM